MILVGIACLLLKLSTHFFSMRTAELRYATLAPIKPAKGQRSHRTVGE